MVPLPIELRDIERRSGWRTPCICSTTIVGDRPNTPGQVRSHPSTATGGLLTEL